MVKRLDAYADGHVCEKLLSFTLNICALHARHAMIKSKTKIKVKEGRLGGSVG